MGILDDEEPPITVGIRGTHRFMSYFGRVWCYRRKFSLCLPLHSFSPHIINIISRRRRHRPRPRPRRRVASYTPPRATTAFLRLVEAEKSKVSCTKPT